MNLAATRIFICTEVVDMRRSFDGLAATTREVMGQDPESGALFVFINRRGNRLKCLWWDKTGYCLLYKRLEWGVFNRVKPTTSGEHSVKIEAKQLASILEGEDPPETHRVRKNSKNRTRRALHIVTE